MTPSYVFLSRLTLSRLIINHTGANADAVRGKITEEENRITNERPEHYAMLNTLESVLDTLHKSEAANGRAVWEPREGRRLTELTEAWDTMATSGST